MMPRQVVLSCLTLGLVTIAPSAIAFNPAGLNPKTLAVVSDQALGFVDPYSEMRQGLLALGMLGLPVVVGLSYKRYRVERCLKRLKQIQRLERLWHLNSKP